MYLLFDIGGTNTRLAFSQDGLDFSSSIFFPTKQDFSLGLAEIKKRADRIMKNRQVEAISGGIAGTLDEKANYLLRAPNLKLWTKRPLRDELKKIFNKPVYLNNDADLVGLGEASFGAGQGFEVVAYLTVSTGVGGVKIVRGKIDKGIYSYEPGWQYVYGYGQDSCNRKNYDFLEYFISGTALAKTYNRPAAAIVDAKIWERVAKILAAGIHNTIVHWSPEVVVLGGSIMKSLSLEKVNDYLQEISYVYKKIPVLKSAELKNKGGLYGALEYVKQKNSKQRKK